MSPVTVLKNLQSTLHVSHRKKTTRVTGNANSVFTNTQHTCAPDFLLNLSRSRAGQKLNTRLVRAILFLPAHSREKSSKSTRVLRPRSASLIEHELQSNDDAKFGYVDFLRCV
ncbi:unnamed protein product [Ixodes pacificus]